MHKILIYNNHPNAIYSRQIKKLIIKMKSFDGPEEETLHKWTDYQAISKLGSGAYSTVWEGIHIPTGTKVAIKKQTDLFIDLIDCKRILREVKILRQLDHPYVIKVYDAFVNKTKTDFDCLYLILELADASLKDVTASPIYLGETQIKKVFYNFMIGLKYLFNAGVLHRDIKPANVLINENCDVKICDFGLSRTALEISCPLSFVKMKRKQLEDAKKTASDPKKDPSPKTAPEVSPKSQPEIEFKAIRTLKKSLTTHVVTRWYRAPEVILMQKDYGFPIDMWSAGCVFAELLGLRKENVKNYLDRKPLFPGGSCFPLSPGHSAKDDARDQLNLIFEVLGAPTEKDINFIEGKDLIEALLSIKKKNKTDYNKLYPACGKEATDILEKMLAFNPYNRITVDKALEHPYFTSVRKKEKEIMPVVHVKLEFDENDTKLDEPALRKMFLEEVNLYAQRIKEGKVYKKK